MTTAMEEALSGETTGNDPTSSNNTVVRSNTASSSTSTISLAAKKVATPAVTAPNATAISAVRKHVSLLVPQPSSAQKPNTARTPSTLTKTPAKSSRSTFG